MIRKIKNIVHAVPGYGQIVQTIRGTVSITRQVTCTCTCTCVLVVHVSVVEHRDHCYGSDFNEWKGLSTNAWQQINSWWMQLLRDPQYQWKYYTAHVCLSVQLYIT